MKADFVVIGAGIAGCSAAYELSKLGATLLLEQHDVPGYHATGRSAAMFIRDYGEPELVALTLLSAPFFETPPEGFTEHALWKQRGRLLLGGLGRDEALDAAYRASRQVAPESIRLSPKDVQELVPVVRADATVGGVLDPLSFDLDVNEIQSGFLRGFRNSGGKLLTQCAVTGLSRVQGLWRVATSVSEFSAPIVINAAGAWVEKIGRMAGTSAKGFTPLRRSACLVDPPEATDIGAWPLVLDVDEQFYFKPDAGKILISPAEEEPSEPCDAQADDFDIACGVDRVEQVTTLSVRRMSHRWAGLRTFAPDRKPVAGFDTDLPDFFWLAGQGGGGIQTSPALGRAAAALISTHKLPPEFAASGLTPASLSPNRLQKV